VNERAWTMCVSRHWTCSGPTTRLTDDPPARCWRYSGEGGDWRLEVVCMPGALTNHGHLRGPWSNHNSQSSPRYLKAMICSSVGRSLSRYVYGIVVWPLNVHCKFFCRRRRTARRCCYLMNSLPGKRAERRMVRLNYARRRYTVTAARV